MPIAHTQDIFELLHAKIVFWQVAVNANTKSNIARGRTLERKSTQNTAGDCSIQNQDQFSESQGQFPESLLSPFAGSGFFICSSSQAQDSNSKVTGKDSNQNSHATPSIDLVDLSTNKTGDSRAKARY
jgi:hypothetical protein